MMLITKHIKKDRMDDFILDDDIKKNKNERKQILLTNRIRNRLEEVKDLHEMQVFLARFIDITSFYEDVDMATLKSFSECPLTDEEADDLGLDLLTWDKTNFLTKDCNFIRMTDISEWRNAAKEEEEK